MQSRIIVYVYQWIIKLFNEFKNLCLTPEAVEWNIDDCVLIALKVVLVEEAR